MLGTPLYNVMEGVIIRIYNIYKIYTEESHNVMRSETRIGIPFLHEELEITAISLLASTRTTQNLNTLSGNQLTVVPYVQISAAHACMP